MILLDLQAETGVGRATPGAVCIFDLIRTILWNTLIPSGRPFCVPRSIFKNPKEKPTMMNTTFNQTAIETALGYRFRNPALLRQAFTRSSYRNEHPECLDNEVSELIGDSVLSLTVLSWFRETYMKVTENGLLTDFDEGQLSALKNGLVNKQHLAERMRQLNLGQYLLVSRGDYGTGIWQENSVLEDLFESVIGAIYVDAGCDFGTVSAIVRRMLDISKMPLPEAKNIRLSWKNELQELTQRTDNTLPVYSTLSDEILPGNAHRITVSCSALGISVTASGKNRKFAEEAAARMLCEKLRG